MSGEDKDLDLDYSEFSQEDENFSDEDLNMMYESFDMVNNLKSQISELEKTKDDLALDVTNIEKKIDDYEHKNPPNPAGNESLEFVSEDEEIPTPPIKSDPIPSPRASPAPAPIEEDKRLQMPSIEKAEEPPQPSAEGEGRAITDRHISEIKDEIVKEFEPIVNNLDMSSLKSNVLGEFKNIVDIEFNKLKSELDLENTRNKRETTKKISDLEAKIVEVIKGAQGESGAVAKVSDEEIEEKVRSSLKKYLDELEQFDRVKTDLEERQMIVRDEIDDLKQNLNDFIDDYNSNLDLKESAASATRFLSEDEKEEFKEYIFNKVNNEVKNLDEKINGAVEELKNKQSKISVERGDADDGELIDKVNDIIENFNDLKQGNKVNQDELKLRLVKEVKSSVTDLIEDTKSKISRQILSNNEFLSKINKKNRELKDKLNESVENKFLVAKQQYEDLFNKKLFEHQKEFEKHIEKFESEQQNALKNFDAFKEKIDSLKKDYQNRLSEEKDFLKNFEKEKEDAQSQFEKLKSDMESLVDEYQGKVELEKGNLDNLKSDFEKDKKQFLTDIESNLNSKKLEINKEFDGFKEEFRETFNDKIHILSNYDEKYKRLIEEKYKGLVSHNNSKLEALEKKFVEKDFEYVKEKIDENLKKFSLYERNLSKKEDEILNKIEYLDEFERSFFSDVTAQTDKLQEKVEDRLTKLEKNLNKRFLDYQSEFDSFKGTIIDEVEDLVKKVNDVLGKKISEVEKLVGTGKLSDIKEGDKAITSFRDELSKKDAQIDELRRSVKDLSTKLEITADANTGGPSMRDYVEYMGSYEKQLLSLIDAFKSKGYDSDSIKSALIEKGHPKFYVAVLLEAIDSQILD